MKPKVFAIAFVLLSCGPNPSNSKLSDFAFYGTNLVLYLDQTTSNLKLRRCNNGTTSPANRDCNGEDLRAEVPLEAFKKFLKIDFDEFSPNHYGLNHARYEFERATGPEKERIGSIVYDLENFLRRPLDHQQVLTHFLAKIGSKNAQFGDQFLYHTFGNVYEETTCPFGYMTPYMTSNYADCIVNRIGTLESLRPFEAIHFALQHMIFEGRMILGVWGQTGTDESIVKFFSSYPGAEPMNRLWALYKKLNQGRLTTEELQEALQLTRPVIHWTLTLAGDTREVVIQPEVDIYVDREATIKRDGIRGVLVRRMNRAGEFSETYLYPTRTRSRPLAIGAIISVRESFPRTHVEESWYHDPETHEVKRGWGRASIRDVVSLREFASRVRF